MKEYKGYQIAHLKEGGIAILSAGRIVHTCGSIGEAEAWIDEHPLTIPIEVVEESANEQQAEMPPPPDIRPRRSIRR